MTTIKIDLKRAIDIKQADVVRLSLKDDWSYVFDVVRADEPQPNTDEARIFTEELDGRYVVVRLANDPPMQIGTKYEKTLHTWIADVGGLPGVNMIGGKPQHYGAPSEMDDKYVVLREFDLVEVQTVVQTGASQDRSERTVFRLTAADVDGILDDIAGLGGPAGRTATDDELARIAQALGHDAVSEVILAVSEEDQP